MKFTQIYNIKSFANLKSVNILRIGNIVQNQDKHKWRKQTMWASTNRLYYYYGSNPTKSTKLEG